MNMLRRATRLVSAGLFVGLCLAAGGCLSSSSVVETSSSGCPLPAEARPDSTAAGMTPQTVVLWTVESVQNRRKYVLSGKSVVTPEGSLRLGPHGTVPVAGMELDQVRMSIANHLARTMPNPQIHLQVVSAPAEKAPPTTLPAPVAKWDRRNQPATAVVAARPRVADAPAPSIVRASYQTEPEGEGPMGIPPSVTRLPETDKGNGDKEDTKDDTTKNDKEEATKNDKDEKTSASGNGTIVAGAPGVGPGCDHPAGAPHELAKTPMPPYVLDIPDIVLIESTQGLRDQPIGGQHIIRPDGTVNLGIYGSAYVAGMTIEEAKVSIAAVLSQRIKDFKIENLNVDVLAYNSKFYYVVTDGGGYGEQVYRFPFTGNETVLDGLSNINGIPAVGSKKHIWVARRGSCETGPCQVLPVNWKGIVQCGCTDTNYQLYPGDRIYVKADPIITVDTFLAKWISPFERLWGVTLLGASTVRVIESANNGGHARGSNNNGTGGGGNIVP